MLPWTIMNPNRLSVLVADGARARLLTLERSADDGSRTRLFERADWIHPEHKMKEHDLFPEPKSDASARAVGGRVYTMDDHRGEHERELDRRFVADVVADVERLIRLSSGRRLIVAAGPRMLGVLRPALSELEARGVEITSIAKDLTAMAPTVIQEHLEREGLLLERALAH
jgi:protein required for attachment to host cells